MMRLLLMKCLLLFSVFAFAGNIEVKNIHELNAANKKAMPGDVIILASGEWNSVLIKLTCHGSKEQPITFRASKSGTVKITGKSQLRISGSYIIVDGLYFTKGYSGLNAATIDFKTDKDNVANNCRVTNTVIDDFNNPKRMDDNNWISFSGKNNRLDHCSIIGKKNMGVVLAVLLDDDRSRANFHSIDHNYFGKRIALGSNGGEMIRVGVSQHCEFNSNTQITDNYFEHCDGETEIISIKSCENVVRGNVFKESQGGVVLRHGNYNTVENNIFLGNNKPGTGGVRVINKGQWVVNNFFYACRGVDFRSPLSLMNGIPNSPAHRYVQVTEAVVANNTFLNCANMSFGEGSDTERTLPPAGVLFANNLFDNQKDPVIYKAFDDISGIRFSGNTVSTSVAQSLPAGFSKKSISAQKNDNIPFPVTAPSAVKLSDSIQRLATERLNHTLPAKTGFSDLGLIKKIQANAYTACGAAWFRPAPPKVIKPLVTHCSNAQDVYTQLATDQPVTITLSGTNYALDKPFYINKPVRFTAASKKQSVLITTASIPAVFVIGPNGHLTVDGVTIDGSAVKAKYFIANDDSGSSEHYNMAFTNSSISKLESKAFFFAHKSMIADSIIIRSSIFTENAAPIFLMDDEQDNKGYYSAEKIVITDNKFSNNHGTLLSLYRGGNDESTMGPNLNFTRNVIDNCDVPGGSLIQLTGVQVSNISANQFIKSNPSASLLIYKDAVRARHIFEKNTISQSGEIVKDKFVTEQHNSIK